MTETCTFSALVDDAVQRSQRRDRLLDIAAYGRSTIRECQVLAFFEQDLVEDSLTVDVLPYLWERPLNLRTMLAAKPSIVGRRGRRLWFKNRPPGQVVADEDFYLYLSGGTFIFSGEELELQETISIAYYTYARKFTYYTATTRPAIFDAETETWTYLAAYDTDDTARANARELVQNWLIARWYDLILEGTLAKILKVVGDDRSRQSFALYKQMQKDLLSGERVMYLRDLPDTNG